MRRRLVLVFAAISLLVTAAFVVPLGFLVQRTAEDRAVDAARADAAAMVPTLVVGDNDPARLSAAMAATVAGREGRMTLVAGDGTTVGAAVGGSLRLEEALTSGRSDIGPVPGGVEVVAAVSAGDGELSAVRVFVPDGQLQGGRSQAWAVLAGVGLALTAIAVLVADRLARSIVRPTEQLAGAARRLGDGDLEARVDVDGPPELVELGGAFNALGEEVAGMLERERELVADLSHRLRTPLTKLRMRVDQVDDGGLASQLRGDVDGVSAAVSAVIREARESLPHEATCDASAVVAERADFWSALADDQGRRWLTDVAVAETAVTLSQGDLEAALDVLIENAFSHTNDGVPLSVALRLEPDVVRIVVGDGGEGIADPELMSAGSSGTGSTGLGLDIARRTAQRGGGRLEVGRSPLGGAEVSLLLPVVERA